MAAMPDRSESTARRIVTFDVMKPFSQPRRGHLARVQAGVRTANAVRWRRVLSRADVASRPEPGVWSALEYACHVRDVHRVFATRVRAMQDTDDPLFENWNQDEAAVQGRYGEQRPDRVADEPATSAEEVASAYARVEGSAWDRPGRRSNGSLFTTASLARYHLHDVEHHLVDVAG